MTTRFEMFIFKCLPIDVFVTRFRSRWLASKWPTRLDISCGILVLTNERQQLIMAINYHIIDIVSPQICRLQPNGEV